MNITVQNTNGTSIGPFDLYYDAVAAPYLLATGITSASLAAGYNLVVPDTATTLYVVNTRNGCGNVAQAITLPPPPTPLTYQSVTISGRLLAATANPQTASVYYAIDNQAYNYLGEITTTTCTTFTSIPVPTNSRILLGIISSSDSVSFLATGSTYLCSNTVLPTDYCGITQPYFQPIYGTTQISLGAKITAGVIAVCGRLPVPPGPTPPPILPATLAYSGVNRTNIRLTIDRTRSGAPDMRIYDLSGRIPIPAGAITGVTIPNIQPGDELVITITSQEDPITRLFVAMSIEQTTPTGQVVLYDTVNYQGPGLVYTDTKILTVQSGGDYTLTVRDLP